MASNPMQRKVRNSFLIGMIITLIICIAIGAAFYFLVIEKERKEREKAEAAEAAKRGKEVKAYVLSQPVESGKVITPDMLKVVEVYQKMIPDNYVDSSLLSTMQSQDADGNILYTDEEGNLYIIIEENSNYKSIGKDEYVLIEQDENGYYKTLKRNNEKEYIVFSEVPTVAKVDIAANTILTTGVIAKSDEIVVDSLRYVEYNMITFPVTIEEGMFIDIRLRLPNGQDLIVTSKKEVKSLYGQTVGFNLTEEEILILNSAIVEAYIMTASELYMTTYVEPGMQTAAIYTYIPTDEVRALIAMDQNIVAKAKNELNKLYDTQYYFNADDIPDATYGPVIRGQINNSEAPYAEDKINNIEIGVQEQIEAARKARENYLSELNGY